MLKIREIQKADIQLIRKWRNHDRKWFYDQAIITEEMQDGWYEKYLADDSDILFIAEAGDGNPVGMYGLTGIDLDAKTAESGRLIIGEKQYTGMGLGVDMMKSVLDYAFDELLLNEIHAYVWADNPSAIIVHTKAGYRIISYRTAWMYDSVYFSITRADLSL